MRKSHAMHHRAGAETFTRLDLAEKFLRPRDLPVLLQQIRQLAQRGREGARPQIEIDVFFTEQIVEWKRHERICWILPRKQLSS